MKAEINAQPVRLLQRYVHYDPGRGAHIWREWAEGVIVSDPEQIALLTTCGAPIEKIETQPPPTHKL
jgi:hypothetical protein